MFYASQENRRKHWYSLLTIGQRKLLVLGGVVVFLALLCLGVLGFYTFRAAEFDLDRVVTGSGSSTLYDSDNQTIGPLSASGAAFVPWDEMPDNLIHAFLAREDEEFFEHGGIVYSSVLRSVLRNIVSWRYEQGASTITMQLTRNVFELHEKTLDRKMLEAVLAQRVEKKYDKATIFTQYLNRIYYGQNCYGIGEAARFYFGKRVRDLDLVECATLAGLVRAPSLCNPRTDMDNAMGVKKECLDRMLELGFITEEAHAAAVAAPISCAAGDGADRNGGSYATLWVNRELDTLQRDLGEKAGGISVVSTLNLQVQQYVEAAMERALVAVERPNCFPEEWETQLSAEPAEAAAQKKAFTGVKRPAALKVRMQDNDLKGLLQACALVVDMRPRRLGQVLAVVGGRSVADGLDRWQGSVKPGRAAAPLVFCCACLPGGDDNHIVARSAEVTGRSIGYDVVRSFFDSLRLGLTLPDRAHEADLYNGLYEMKRLDLARVLYDIMNQGRGYRLSLVNTIWSRGGVPIYAYEAEKAPEYIRRESAVTISRLSPFIAEAGKPVLLHETLPDNGGCFTMACNPKGVCVFVWMGLDDPHAPAASSRELNRLVGRASLYLARELHAQAREVLRESAKDQKKAQKPAKP